jgi:hypothetical protein
MDSGDGFIFNLSLLGWSSNTERRCEMEEIINVLKSLHEDIKDQRPKADKLSGGAGYSNGFEDGYKLVTKRIKKHIEDLESLAK